MNKGLSEMTEQIAVTTADRELKAKHRAIWALGDYPAVVAQIIPELGTTLVEAAGITSGDRVLDVAAGTGNAAIPAALAGSTVVASDLTPELLAAGRAQAADQGVELTWDEGDAEALPYADGEFDVVMSCLGAMFAPHHADAAGELLRVCRPGGTIALLNWTPEGFIGQLFATMKPYAPPPPPGVQPPPLWGSEDHVQQLLGHGVENLSMRRRTLTVDRFARPEEFRDYFKANYGPAVAVYRANSADPERQAALDHDLAELARRFDLGGGRMEWEYLLVTARRT